MGSSIDRSNLEVKGYRQMRAIFIPKASLASDRSLSCHSDQLACKMPLKPCVHPLISQVNQKFMARRKTQTIDVMRQSSTRHCLYDLITR